MSLLRYLHVVPVAKPDRGFARRMALDGDRVLSATVILEPLGLVRLLTCSR